jgi:hypothetical protein
MARRGFGLTTTALRGFAYDIAEQNGIVHAFSERNKLAGKDSLRGFIKRHPEVAVPLPDATSIGRWYGFSRPQVERFFYLQLQLYAHHKLPASRVYNCDESVLSTVPTKLPTVLAAKDAKRVPKITSAERGKSITIVCAMNAAGTFVSPVFIFPRIGINDNLLIGAPPGSIGISQRRAGRRLMPL